MRPAAALRRGRYKLIEWYEDGSLELYDLRTDPGENHDLSSEQPELAAELQRALADWRLRVGANMPQRR